MIKSIYMQTLNILKKIPVKLWGISLLGGVLSIAASILGGIPIISIALAAAFSAGMVAVYYNAYRSGGEAEINTLFMAFKDWKTFKRIAGGMCWMYLWLFLWFIIPIAGPFIAIYKSFQYAFTPYILTHEPTVSGRAALKKSIEDTNGFKGNMFIAIFLPAIAFVILSGILSALGLIPYVGVLFTIINVLVTLVWYVIAPLFLGLVESGFYDFGKKPIKKTAPVILAPPAAEAAPSAEAAPTENAEAPSANVCPVCGTENNADKKFCTKCGAKL